MNPRPLLLKVGATVFALATTLVSALYVTSHLKNADAPLQPSVLSGTGSSATVALPGGGTLTLAPSVRPTDAQPVASTYAS